MIGRSRCVALSLLLAAGCDLPGKPTPEDRYVPPHEEKRFSVLFQQNCAACHGADGKLGPAPPLNDKLFLDLIPADQLRRVITEGRSGTLMPAFAETKGGPLTDDQIGILAAGIRQEWGQANAVPSRAPPYLSEQAEHGDMAEGVKVFDRACASCHGDQGQGGHYGGKMDGRSVGAINDPDFLALISDQALRRYVITGRPDLGMPDFADPTGRPKGFKPLTSQDVSDVVARLASWRHGGSRQAKGD
jgi:cytochrome c oxidase cbb3-type subunit 3/ubiquinol-cytochrome c reductase cytochrome c subunit